MAVKSVRKQVQDSLLAQLGSRYDTIPRYLREQVAVYMAAYDRMKRLEGTLAEMPDPAARGYIEASREWRQLSSQQLQILDKLGLSRPDLADAAALPAL